MIADMRVQTDAARLLVFRARRAEDQGRPSTTEASIAKLYATEAARTARTWRSRSTAAPATSTTTRSSATSATCA